VRRLQLKSGKGKSGKRKQVRASSRRLLRERAGYELEHGTGLAGEAGVAAGAFADGEAGAGEDGLYHRRRSAGGHSEDSALLSPAREATALCPAHGIELNAAGSRERGLTKKSGGGDRH
jgi:hypothetical protein